MNHTETSSLRRILELLLVSFKLGLTSFGGPAAHIGYFHEEYVQRKKWLDEKTFAELNALCQFLPGPASSQLGISIGLLRAGIPGGLASFIGFTFPSVVIMYIFAVLLNGNIESGGDWIHGLKIVAAVIVMHAVISMGSKLANGRITSSIAILAAMIVSFWQNSLSQLIVILLAGTIGFVLLKRDAFQTSNHVSLPLTRRTGVAALITLVLLLLFIPFINRLTTLPSLMMFDHFFRTGALVFGGGHVVLPLLQSQFVENGLISKESFLSGYGAAQTIPGPLFTFSAYIGAVINGWKGALLATVAIFLPAFLLILGTLPFWNTLRKKQRVQGTLAGVNAAVVGLLLAALYDPIFTNAIFNSVDFAIGAVLFGLLQFWKLPPWSIALLGAFSGWLV